MDYHRIYREFIANRKMREPSLSGYVEKHHILPKSLGGGNEAENLIRLTAEDHFFAHLLLAKMYGGGMWSALSIMKWGRVSKVRHWAGRRYLYGVARRKMAEHLSVMFSGQPGRSGRDNSRYDETVLCWTNLDTGACLSATKAEMWDRFGGTRPHWTSVATGARRSMLGWCVKPEHVRIRSGKGKSFSFENRDGRAFAGTQSALCKLSGLSAPSVSRITRHGDVSLCGWRLAGTNDRRSYESRSGGKAWQYRKAVPKG